MTTLEHYCVVIYLIYSVTLQLVTAVPAIHTVVQCVMLTRGSVTAASVEEEEDTVDDSVTAAKHIALVR